MKYTQLTIASCAALLVSNVALAAPVKFKAADANADGFVDAAEFAKSGGKQELTKLDKDKDGKLSKKEYSVVLEEECE